MNGKKESDYTLALNSFLSQIVPSIHFLRDEIIKFSYKKKKMSIENIQSGFMKSGIVPIDVNQLLFSDFAQETHQNSNIS